MRERDLTNLYNIVRFGSVSSVDAENRTARVAFADKPDKAGRPLISAPLKVIQSPPFVPAQGAAQETQPKGGGSGTTAYEPHAHGLIIKPWLPHVGQFVLCIFLPNGEGDGFVIGGI